MLEIRRTAIGLDEKELVKLKRIITDGDEKEALRFVKKVYNRVERSQRRCEAHHARD